jgi:hypothetical protein
VPSWLVAFLSFSLAAFQASTLKPSPIQHVTVAATAMPATAGAGEKVTLLLDVTPDRNIHVYAPGAKDFIPTTLTAADKRVTFGKITYPPAELVLDPILNEGIPEYVKPFRITLPVTLPGKLTSGESLTISGALTYQACDDKMCFAPSVARVSWILRVR